MAIEIVDLPFENGGFPVRYVSLSEGKHIKQGPNRSGSNPDMLLSPCSISIWGLYDTIPHALYHMTLW